MQVLITEIDPAHRKVYCDNQEIHLTAKEYLSFRSIGMFGRISRQTGQRQCHTDEKSQGMPIRPLALVPTLPSLKVDLAHRKPLSSFHGAKNIFFILAFES